MPKYLVWFGVATVDDGGFEREFKLPTEMATAEFPLEWDASQFVLEMHAFAAKRAADRGGHSNAAELVQTGS